MNKLLSRNDALMAIITQFCLVVALLLFVIWPAWGLHVSVSFAVGGLICVLPNVYLYSRVFAYFGATQAKQIVRALFGGETIKLILTGCGFVGAFLTPGIRPQWVFYGYIAAQVGFWLAPIVMSYRLSVRKAPR